MRSFEQELRQAISAAGYDLKGPGPATKGNERRTLTQLAKDAHIEKTFLFRLKKDRGRSQVVQQIAGAVRLATVLGTTVERLVAGINAAYEVPDSDVRPSSRPRTK